MKQDINIENEPSADFVRGYNEGYLIAQELPETANALSKVLGDTERAKGFQSGFEQLSMEKEKADKGIYPNWLEKDSTASGNREQQTQKNASVHKDLGDVEPEKC